MTVTMEVTGLKELIDRFEKWPHALTKSTAASMAKAITEVNKAVPPYPPPLPNQKYVRTEKLGRSLGSSFAGGMSGNKPDVFTVRQLGTHAGAFEGRFGSNIPYSPYVLDDNRQAGVHRGRWWTMSGLAKRAAPKVMQVFEKLAAQMAAYLDRGAK